MWLTDFFRGIVNVGVFLTPVDLTDLSGAFLESGAVWGAEERPDTAATLGLGASAVPILFDGRDRYICTVTR